MAPSDDLSFLLPLLFINSSGSPARFTENFQSKGKQFPDALSKRLLCWVVRYLCGALSVCLRGEPVEVVLVEAVLMEAVY